MHCRSSCAALEPGRAVRFASLSTGEGRPRPQPCLRMWKGAWSARTERAGRSGKPSRERAGNGANRGVRVPVGRLAGLLACCRIHWIAGTAQVRQSLRAKVHMRGTGANQSQALAPTAGRRCRMLRHPCMRNPFVSAVGCAVSASPEAHWPRRGWSGVPWSIVHRFRAVAPFPGGRPLLASGGPPAFRCS